jgi:hypothetical protein
MVDDMAKEISSELSLLSMNLSPPTMSLDKLYKLLAIATISIPENIKTDFSRDQGISIVQADVLIEAKDITGEKTLQATVSIILKYKGDMVRIPFAVKNKIRVRLQKIAQQYCAEEAYKIIVKSSLK